MISPPRLGVILLMSGSLLALAGCHSGNVRVSPALVIGVDNVKPHRGGYHHDRRCHRHPRKGIKHCH